MHGDTAVPLRARLLEELSARIAAIINTLTRARYVNYGDYVLADDINSMITVAQNLVDYNNSLIGILEDLGVTVPDDAKNLADQIARLYNSLRLAMAGDLVDAEQWRTITLILKYEYDLLNMILQLQDIVLVEETFTVTETLNIIAPTLASVLETLRVNELVQVIKGLVTAWRMYRNDARNTGRTTGATKIHAVDANGNMYTITVDGELLWKKSLCSARRLFTANCLAVSSSDTIYCAGLYGDINAIDAYGNIIWSIQVGTSTIVGPALLPDNNIVYVTSDDNDNTYMVIVDSSGNIVSSVVINNDPSSFLTIDNYDPQYTYIQFTGTDKDTNEPHIVSVIYPDLITGLASLNDISYTTPATFMTRDYHRIYVGDNSGYVYAFAQLTKALAHVWSVQLSNPVDAPIAVSSDGVLYVAERSNNIDALGPDGRLEWQYTVSNANPYAVAVASNGTLVVSYRLVQGRVVKGHLMALNSNGSLIFDVPLNGATVVPATIDGDGYIYVGDFSPAIYKYTASGSLVWSLATDAEIVGEVVIV